MDELTREEWKDVTARLRATIPADEIELKWTDYKIQAGGRGEVLAYVTARGIRNRLDDVVPGGWAFTWEPISLDAKGHVQVAKGRLTIYGVSREDVCEASTYSPDKGAVSGVEKRVAQQWGIGRELYDLPDSYATADSHKQIPEAFIAKWRADYARATGQALAQVAAPQLAKPEAVQDIPRQSQQESAPAKTAEDAAMDWEALKRDATMAFRLRTGDEFTQWVRKTLGNASIQRKDITPAMYAKLQQAINDKTPAISGLLVKAVS